MLPTLLDYFYECALHARLTSISTSTMTQLQPDIIVARLSKSSTNQPVEQYPTSNPDQPSTFAVDAANSLSQTASTVPMSYHTAWSVGNMFGEFEYQEYWYRKRKVLGYPVRQPDVKKVIARYRTPPWMANQVWRLQAVKAFAGWKFCIQTYTVVDFDAPAFECAHSNDVKGLQELFSSKRASPFDCNRVGSTLLFCE